jgi:uncharacterized SAM-binding protein YcdF (DUF218 family)
VTGEAVAARPQPGVPSVGSRPRRRRRIVFKVLFGVACLVVTYFAITFAQVVSTSRVDDAAGTDVKPAQALVVLGAAQYDGVPSPVLRGRLDHALELYRRGLAPVVVVTGGRQSGDRFTEATAGYDYLRARGVPDAAIRKEVHGRTTWESLRATSTFLHDEGIDDVFIVSDGYHSKRALGIAAEVGLDARVSPSKTPMSTGTRLRADLRETVAVGLGRIIGYRMLDHR